MQHKIVTLQNLNKEELVKLLTDAAKNWLCHDGLWFQAVEKKFGINAAIELDGKAWKEFTQIEAQRIMKRLNMKSGGGIPALIQALNFRLYAYINKQEVTEVSEQRCIFRMVDCRVQAARKRKNLPDFPCKPVGFVEYEYFAKTIDPRIQTRCIACPPDPHPKYYYCAWEFVIP
ncbi:hypothetical protein AMJ52_01785 [candidate division TA06 bacterium DG_78]|uniref:Cytosolic protein n=1 Tax=candidate division TA06 bacterium DG_78 TaxID=1703772 RepID=A0A0S7YH92_UNCT6|nr:MAG: hypothetical protein AMJ52_01785 [candidate division TA06 bacterium DG_78]